MTAPGPVVAVIQARMTSSRLAGKVMKPLAGAPLIRRVVERVQRIDGVDTVAVALAEGETHDPVVGALGGLRVNIVRGPETDVLARTVAACRAEQAATVMRITSDCPFVDPGVSAAVLAAYAGAAGSGIVYTRTAVDRGFPLGFDTEVFAAATLYDIEQKKPDPYEREHVTPYIWRRPETYPALHVDAKPDRRHWRLVVDTEEDYRFAAAVYDALYPDMADFGYAELCALFAAQPDLLNINAHVGQTPYAGID